MRNSENELRTPRYGTKLGEIDRSGNEPVLKVRRGGKYDEMSFSNIVEAFYGVGTRASVIEACRIGNIADGGRKQIIPVIFVEKHDR